MSVHLRREAREFLSRQAPAIRPPIRSVLFGQDRLRQHGVSLAQAQPVERRRSRRRRVRTPHFFPPLQANVRMLERTKAYLERLDREQEVLGPAAEWLLDNFHLIEAQWPEVLASLSRRYYAELPKLRRAPLAGLPRIYGIAWAFVAHTDANFDAGLLASLLGGYQEVDTLTLGELWALPSTLRVVLMEDLARLAEAVATAKAAREAASWCCDHESTLSLRELEGLYAACGRREVGPVFLAQMVQRVQGEASAAPSRLSEWLAAKVDDIGALLAKAQAAEAADNVSVSNAVTALRKIANIDWLDLVRACSPVLQTLEKAPAFRADSSLTQDLTTHGIERLARRLSRSENEVAKCTVHLCIAATAPLERSPAHWVVGEGKAVLLAALGTHEKGLTPRARQWWQRWRTTLYGLALAIGLAGLLGGFAGRGAAPPWLAGLVLVLMAFPGLECVMALVHRMLAEAVKVHRLPRLALPEGVGAEHRTLVAVPCMLSSIGTVEGLLARIERHCLANPDPGASFALLSDWNDAATATAPGDDALLDAAREGIEALNRKYPGGATPRFLLLHRERAWSADESVWMGWERKRGKVEQLLALLADPQAPRAFVDLGAISRLEEPVRYVLVLDSDTGLPPACLREMVSIAAHPLNRPRIDASTRRVVSGYGILQPRLACLFPAEEEVTPFGWMFAAPWGTDAYNGGSSEVYQDVFGEGSFCGKGLYDVQAVHEVLRGRVAPGRLLSHDLFEGLWARCAYLSDVVVIEGHPMHPEVAAARHHRWTRGDWQLLAFLGAALRGGVGGLNVWKVLDNLRRSLLAPACVLLLWIAFTTGALLPALAAGLVAAALGLGPLVGAVAGFAPGRTHIAWQHLLREAAIDLLRAGAASFWQLATLMHLSLLNLDAIARALWRMAVSRRQLLQWTTAAQVQAQARRDWLGFWRRHAAECVASAFWTASALAMPGAAKAWVLAFGALWLLTPAWLWAAARPLGRAHRGVLPEADRQYLRQLSRDTWRFFEETVTAADHWLPPDNLQLDPQPMVAHRTSPTNIGLYLLSAVCARRLDFIDGKELAQRLHDTLSSVERLPGHRGHVFNWIDTLTLQALPPHYVSTVDSGNLAACLWATAQACRELSAQEPDAAAGWLALASRADAMVEAMEFGFLYDARRRLFHIGFRCDDAAPDPAYYDLLASESRLTGFLAIAKQEVPRRHWEALGRPFLAFEGRPALRSWSGSMFEYLMPRLLMSEPRGGLLQRVSSVAVAAQRRFGAVHGIPWGVSECAYYAQDHTLAFQYSPFGVPSLALRRTPPDDRVVAPYATALAAMVSPRHAVQNLRAIEECGGRERLGFIEALDFSASRQGAPRAPQRVAAHMAHHQGMSLVALCDTLCEGAAREWFHGVPRVGAHEVLLHERMPREIVLQEPTVERSASVAEHAESVSAVREFDLSRPQPWLPTQWLSNGRYGVSLRPTGAGSSGWRGRAIHRASDDALRDAHGTWLLLRREGEDAFHSLTQAPCPRAHTRYRARFLPDHVEFSAGDSALEASVLVWVSPDDDVEFRNITLHNLLDEPMELDLASFFEATLAAPAADEAHPAFSNLFLRAHALDPQAIVFERRPRLEHEPSAWMAHFLGVGDAEILQAGACCDREALLGRRGTLQGLRFQASLPLRDGLLDTGLDPAASLCVRIRLAPHAHARITFATAAADDCDALLALIDEYRQQVHESRARAMAATVARIRLRELGLSAADLHAAQDVASLVGSSRARPRALPSLAIDRRALWRLALSGDRPLLVVRIGDPAGLPALRVLMAAQRLWEAGGLATDLVVLNAEPGSYLMPLQAQLVEMSRRLGGLPHGQPERAEVRLLRVDEVSPAEQAALHACARLDLVSDGRPLARMLAQLMPPGSPQSAVSTRREMATPPGDAWAPNGFEDGGRAYSIELRQDRLTPRPWSNVLANPQFGCLVSESGGGFTWALNSRMNQLTPWSNDALLDPPCEHFIVESSEDGPVFGLMPTLDRNGSAGYRVRHLQGCSVFEQERDGLGLRTVVSVHPQESCKVVQVSVVNRSPIERRLRLVACVEWTLGSQRRDRMTLATEPLPPLELVMARQLEHQGGFGEGCAFLMQWGIPIQGWTCDRTEFFDALGRFCLPPALAGSAGFGLDPCGAVEAQAVLAPGESLDMGWALGYAPGREAALSLARRLKAEGFLPQVAAHAQAHWDERLSRVVVSTPDPRFDALVNRWLPYQAVGCRVWARTGFYQASGAFGFRDQLQDALALGWTDPALLREQILLHASRQFPQGDVQHWWHAPGGAGVRTRFSDDLLWLPFAVTRYLECSPDAGLLESEVAFIEGPAVPDGAEDAYFVPGSAGGATLYEHCARALDRGLAFGAHGLPLMGTGDWNDGMNRVGHQGRGESVWLGWFLLVLLPPWVDLAARRGDVERANRWRSARDALSGAMTHEAWDGHWYRRAFFDNGHPLGSSSNVECRIDLIAQAWSVFADGPGDPRAREAMAAADELLVDRVHGLIRLLDPPLQASPDHAGYIQSYPPGVRENGGQYAHAATWALLAQARLGHADLAWDYFRCLSPAHRAEGEDAQRRYRIEPYVMPGDVYSAPPYEGRGGWSWYTGSAAWMWRACVEGLLGLSVRPGALRLSPCLPPHWPGARVALRIGGRSVEVVLSRAPSGAGPWHRCGEWISLDEAVPGRAIHFVMEALETATAS